MPSDSKKPRAAYIEDCDEDDKALRGTRRSASTKGKGKGEREGRSSKDRYANGDSGYSSQALTTESDNSLSPRSTRVEVVRERSASDKAPRRTTMSGASTRSPNKSSRPPLTRERATAPLPPQLDIPLRPRTDPSYYGVSPTTTSTPNSSVRSRPVSYYGGMPTVVSAPVPVSRPPLARSAFYPQSAGMGGASYPMGSPVDSYMRYVPVRPDPYAVPDPLRSRDHLAERFSRADPISRTTSAQGYRPMTEGLMNQPSFDQDLDRQTIRRRVNKEAEDYRMMPPPPRRTSVIDARDLPPYPAESYLDGAGYDRRSSYRDPSPAPRPIANRGSTYGYGQERAGFQIEVPTQRRRASYYEEMPASTLEDKMRQATGYQEEVTGGPPLSLTAEALRKQQRTAASSRSTHSSGSRDESDFRRSATTRTSTSRVAPDGEDFVIKFKGSATVNIAGAEIKCDDGAELNIVRSKSIRNGSERSASEYGMVATDDRRSRSNQRPSTYSRSASKSGFSSPVPTTPRRRTGGFF